MALDTIPKQEGGKLKAVASGTLPSGQPVVVNSDGTVSVVGINTVSETVGTAVVFESATSDNMSAAYDANAQKVVVAYRDQGNSFYGTAVVGTISGTSVSFGTPVVFTTLNTQFTDISYDANAQKVVIVYNGSNNGNAIVGTVSGTSISFGSSASLGTNAQGLSVVYDSSAQKLVVSYYDNSNSNYGTSRVGTISGTGISFGTAVVFASHNAGYYMSQAFDSANNKVVIAYTNSSDGQKGTSIVGTVSGTSISFGSAVVFDAGEIAFLDVAYDVASGKSVIVYMKGPGGNQGANAIVGTISGTSISFGTAVVYDSGSGNENNTIVYHEAAEKVIVVYWDNSNSDRATALTGTVSGTSISFENSVVLEQGASSFISPAYDSTNEVVFVALKDDGNSGHGTGVVYQPTYSATNLTSENYIGMSGGVVDVAANVPQVIGTPSQFESGNTVNLSSTYDAANDKVVFAYRDSGNSNRGTAVVGTVSGTSITFGTPVVFATGTTYSVAITYDSTAEKVVVVYRDNSASDNGKARVGTVSGTSISFGSQVTFASAATYDVSATFDSSADKVVAVYMDGGNSNYGTAIVGTVSGTSISFGSEVVFSSSSTSLSKTATVFDSTNNKVVIAYRDVGDSDYGKAIVGTVSGTSISFGSASTFASAQSLYVGATYDSSAGKVVAAYVDGANSSYGTAVVGTVSGTSISFGSEVVFNSASTEQTLGPSYDATANRVVIAYQNAGDSNKGTLAVGTVSGTSIEFEAPVVFETAEAKRIVSVYDPDAGKIVIGYSYDAGGAVTGKAIVSQTGYQDITRGSVADGDNATIDIVGTVSTNQVGLTPGQQYYVQTDGTIGTTPADPSVLAGTAVSATKMVVKS
jgi:hypothetical protein